MTQILRKPRFVFSLLGALAVFALLGAVASNASPTAQGAADRAGRSHTRDRADRSERPRRGLGRLGRGEVISRYLVLDEAQSAKVTELVEQLREEVSPLRGSRKTAREQIRAELDATRPDAEKVGQLVIQAHASRGDLRTALTRFDQDLSALLRPEQLTRYQEWKKNHPRLLSGERRRGGRREHGGR